MFKVVRENFRNLEKFSCVSLKCLCFLVSTKFTVSFGVFRCTLHFEYIRDILLLKDLSALTHRKSTHRNRHIAYASVFA